MKRSGMCLSALIATLVTASLANAAGISGTQNSLVIPKGSTNQFGQQIQASVALTVKVDRVYIRVTNDTPDIASFDQTISGISFKLPNKVKEAHMGSSSATIRVLSADGFKDGLRPDDTRWQVNMEGDVVTVHAPGQRYTILPDTRKNYPKADITLLDYHHSPYTTKTVFLEVVFPDSGLTDQLTDIHVLWGHELSLLESNITGGLTGSTDTPNPPTEGGTLPPGDTPPGTVPGGGDGGGGGGGGGGDGGGTNTPVIPPIIPPTNPPTDPPPVDPPVDPPPVIPNTPDTPEPATLSVLMIGAAGLLMRRRK